MALAERAAAALAMHRLHDRNRDSQLRRLHHELLVALLANPGDADTLRRVELAGTPVQGRRYVGVALRPAHAGTAGRGDLATQLDEIVAASLRAAELIHARPLVAAFETDVRILLPVPGRADPIRLTDRFVSAVAERTSVTAAAGTPVPHLQGIDRTLREAMHVMSSLSDGHKAPGVHRLEDVHLRGLLALLAEDERVSAFAERELAPLRAAVSDTSFDLIATTRAVVENWGSKSAAAAELRVSRPVLYDRIARIQDLFGARLDDAEARTSLHVALIIEEVPSSRRET